MGSPQLARDPRFVDHKSRGANMAELDEVIATWTRRHGTEEILSLLHEAAVPCGRVYEPADMVEDPHFRARRSLVEIEDGDHGTLIMLGVVPKLSATPRAVRWAGPSLGAHTDEVLVAVGLAPDEIAALRFAGAI